MKPIAVDNPPNPWESEHVEWLGEPPEATLKVYEERARSILSENQSPDLPFRYSLNPYRGCLHGCAYCYARPTHEYLSFGAGSDFERRIVVKVNAAELLERKLDSPRWEPETIVFSGVTDCYQPLEASYGITRACLEVCAIRRNPVGIITKGSLIRRDVGTLAEMSRWSGARVFVSIPFADDAVGWALEPMASAISQRFKTLKVLSEAGVEVGVSVAPMIPGLTDRDLPEILERAFEAGARWSFMQMLRLPGPVVEIFEQRLRAHLPEAADRVLGGVDDMRDGQRQEGRFGRRMVGEGPRWEATRRLYETTCERLGYRRSRGAGLSRSHFQRGGQQRLF